MSKSEAATFTQISIGQRRKDEGKEGQKREERVKEKGERCFNKKKRRWRDAGIDCQVSVK